MESAAQEVDYLYTKMSYLPDNMRSYEQFSDYYLDIKVKLNALRNRQKSRSVNELTLKQVDIILQLWRQDRVKHQQQGAPLDFF